MKRLFAQSRLWWFRQSFAVLLVWSCFIFVMAMFAWASGRGFDLTDEGFYHMRGLYWREYLSPYTQFGVLMHLLQEFCGYSLWKQRLLTVVGCVLSGLLFWIGAKKWLNQRLNLSIEGGAPLMMLWSLAGFAWLPVALSYNTLNGIAVTAWAGLWLWLRTANSWKLKALLFLCALLSVAAKPSTGLLLLAGSFFPCLPPMGKWGKVRLGACKAVIWSIAALVSLSVLLDAASRLGLLPHHLGMDSGTEAVAADVSFGGRLWSHFASLRFLSLFTFVGQSLIDYGWLVVQALAFPALLCVALRWWKSQPGSHAGSIAAAAAVLCSCVVYHNLATAAANYQQWMFFGAGDQMTAVITLGVSWLILFHSEWVEMVRADCRALPWDHVLDWLLLLALPVVGWLGTHNEIGMNAIFQSAPWVLLAVIGAAVAQNAVSLPSSWVVALLGLAVTCYLWLGVVEHPYRQPQPLYRQEKIVTMGPHRLSHTMDGKTGSLINQTKTLLRNAGFKTGDPVLALYHLPGLVYAVGGESPRLAAYSAFDGVHRGLGISLRERNNIALRSLSEDELKQCFILQTPGSVDFVPLFLEKGIRFPEDYRLLGKVPIPPHHNSGGELSVWQPVARN